MNCISKNCLEMKPTKLPLTGSGGLGTVCAVAPPHRRDPPPPPAGTLVYPLCSKCKLTAARPGPDEVAGGGALPPWFLILERDPRKGGGCLWGGVRATSWGESGGGRRVLSGRALTPCRRWGAGPQKTCPAQPQTGLVCH